MFTKEAKLKKKAFFSNNVIALNMSLNIQRICPL